MLDLRFVRDNAERVREVIRQKNARVDLDELLGLDEERRRLQQRLDDLGRKRHEIAARGSAGTPTPEDIDAGKTVKAAVESIQEEFQRLTERVQSLLAMVPNIPTEDTPVGNDETENRVLREWGTIPQFSFIPKEHWELGHTLGLIDNERAAKVSGSRFTYLTGDAALLEFALLHFSLSILVSPDHLTHIAKHSGAGVPPSPWIPVIPPALIRPEALQAMARLEPREDRYHVPTDDLYLVGSAEHTLGAMHMDETFPEESMPRRYVGFSSAFRREAGSYGRDVHGILRMHQFDKLELESFTVPEQGLPEQEFIVALQQYLMEQLGLPHRVVLMCTGEMSAPDARQIDLETWFPGQNRYRETHSADYTSDYQARRLKTRVRRRDGTVDLVHMNDATVFAIGRTIAAIFENYQRADGSIGIPQVLRQYFGGRDTFTPLIGS